MNETVLIPPRHDAATINARVDAHQLIGERSNGTREQIHRLTQRLDAVGLGDEVVAEPGCCLRLGPGLQNRPQLDRPVSVALQGHELRRKDLKVSGIPAGRRFDHLEERLNGRVQAEESGPRTTVEVLISKKIDVRLRQRQLIKYNVTRIRHACTLSGALA